MESKNAIVHVHRIPEAVDLILKEQKGGGTEKQGGGGGESSRLNNTCSANIYSFDASDVFAYKTKEICCTEIFVVSTPFVFSLHSLTLFASSDFSYVLSAYRPICRHVPDLGEERERGLRMSRREYG